MAGSGVKSGAGHAAPELARSSYPGVKAQRVAPQSCILPDTLTPTETPRPGGGALPKACTMDWARFEQYRLKVSCLGSGGPAEHARGLASSTN